MAADPLLAPADPACTFRSRLWQHTPAIILTLDQTGRFTSLNPAAETLFARTASSLLGQPFTAVLDTYSHTKAMRMLERTLAEGAVADWELDHLRPDGSLVLVSYATCRLQDDAGDGIGIGAIGNDMTGKLVLTAELARANQELEGALLDLEKTNAQLKTTQVQLVQSEKMRALGQMITGVAQEINNPVAFVAGNLTQLAEIGHSLRELFIAYAPLKVHADSAQQAVIRAAEDALPLVSVWRNLADIVTESYAGIERIRQIVFALRNFSRVDEAALQSADLNLALQGTIQIVRPVCQDRIQLHENYTQLPSLHCHPGELSQVFLNLLTNAVQSIHGVGEIWVSTLCTQQTITIKIRDSGAGMSAATLARLGEPSFTTKPAGAGSGLGLAVAFGIVQRHRGTMRFASKPGQGTMVAIDFPII